MKNVFYLIKCKLSRKVTIVLRLQIDACSYYIAERHILQVGIVNKLQLSGLINLITKMTMLKIITIPGMNDGFWAKWLSADV